VAPYSAFPAWHDELIRERFTEKEMVFLVGTRAQRLKKFKQALSDSTVKWYIINVEGWRALQEIALQRWQAMVFDESYSLQSPPHVSEKTKTICTSKFFTRNFRDVPYKYILTGTPAPESELNYFMQLLFLDKNILCEDNYWKFRTRNFIQYCPHQYAISEYGKRFLTKQLATCAVFVSRKDVNLGGEKIYEQRAVELDKETREIYDRLCNLFILGVGDKIHNVTDIAAVKFSWSRRLLGGFIGADEEREDAFEYIFDGKLVELNKLLTGELREQQVVIWADFTKEIRLIHRHLRTSKKRVAVIDGSILPQTRDMIEKSFRSGNIQYLVCQPQASQYSRDFSSADTEIFYSSPLALKTRLQAEDRLISTKTNSVLVVDLVCKDTIEEDIIESLHKKETKQQMIARIVKRLTGENHGRL